MNYFNNFASAAKTRYANLRIASFTDSDNDHPENEDESAVSRALRDYYKEKDGFVPDWLTPVHAPPVNNMPQNKQQYAVPPRMAAGQGAMLGDIFNSTGAPPPQQQQQQAGMQRPGGRAGMQPMGRQPSPQQVAPHQPPPQQQPGGLPSKPKGGIRPFMARKKEAEQAAAPQSQSRSTPPPQQQQAYSAPPSQQYQPPPPLPSFGSQPQPAAGRQGLKDRMLNRSQPSPGSTNHSNNSQGSLGSRDQQYYTPSQSPSGGSRYQAPPPQQQHGGGGGRSRFAAAAGDTGGRSSGGRSDPKPSASGKPFVSATAPWAGGADEEYGDFGGGWGASPGFYGK